MRFGHAAMRCAAFLALLLLASCGKAEAPPATPDKPSSNPALATHPDYSIPAGWRTECIGRQLVDVPADMQWVLADRIDLSLNGAVFSEWLKGVNDVWGHDGMSVGVSPVGDDDMWEEVKQGERSTVIAFTNVIKDQISTGLRLSKRAADEGDPVNALDWKKTVKEREAVVASFRELDFGIPDSFIRTTGADVRAFLWRNKRVHRFVIGGKPENLKKAIVHMRDYLSRFRTRALYEIPTGPGVCYPYAFVADNGKRWFDIKNSFRLADAMGVIYAVRIGRNSSNLDMGAMETLLMASPFMQSVMPRTGGVRELGLQNADIGPYPVWFSGVVMANRSHPADGDYYRVVSAFMGEENSDTLPFIRFEMNGFARGHDTPQSPMRSPTDSSRLLPVAPFTITQPTPPVEQSIERMRAIMKSIRLRPGAAAN